MKPVVQTNTTPSRKTGLLEYVNSFRIALFLGLILALTAVAPAQTSAGEEQSDLKELVYEGITYRQLEKGSNIYVPSGATPEQQASDAYHPWTREASKLEINDLITEDNPIDEVRYTITPEEYMSRIIDIYKIAVEHNGEGYPDSMEGVYKLAEKHGWPVYLLGYVGDIEKVEEKTLIVPEKLEGGGYSIGMILEKPSEETKIPYLTLRLPIAPEGKVLEEGVTLMKEGESMRYTERRKRYIEIKGMIRAIANGGYGIESYKIPEGMIIYTAFLPLAVEKIVEESGKRIAYITPIPATPVENRKKYW